MKTTLAMLVALALLVSLSPPLRAQDQSMQGKSITIPDGTEFNVTPTEEINSKHATEGDVVVFRVVDDVEVTGHTVIRKGAIVKGMVTNVEGRGMLGKAGKLSVRIDKTTAIDGQKVRLRASKGKEGGSNTGKVIALSILVTPLFLLMRGNTARIKPGMQIPVFTDEDKRVSLEGRNEAAQADTEEAERSETTKAKLTEKRRKNNDWHKMSDQQ